MKIVAALLFFTQLALCQKFVGSVSGGSVPSSFATYWNQIGPENAGKWGNVQSNDPDSYNWSQFDAIYNYAQAHSIPFKEHTLVWGYGSGVPGFLYGMNNAQIKQAVKNWFSAMANRYPNIQLIDVVNEPYQDHNPFPFRSALGSGDSWIDSCFAWARERFPNAELILNDYYVLTNSGVRSWIKSTANRLKSHNLIDGIGCQGHWMEGASAQMITDALNDLGTTGLKVYVTEFDLNISDDPWQKTVMQNLCTAMIVNQHVAGITYWGYLQGQTWQQYSYLLRSNGTERPALTWLREYITSSLPVEIIYFTGTDGTVATLNWATLTEHNNYGFFVERKSAVYGAFEHEAERWNTVGFVPGNGTTNVPHEYEFIDNPVPGTWFYGLKQVDYGGQFKFIGPVTVTVNQYRSFGLFNLSCRGDQ